MTVDDELTDAEIETEACPHADIRFCPLYHAAHGGEWGEGISCDDGRLAEGGCAVDRGMDYTAAVARLRAKRPHLVAELGFAKAAAEGDEQRKRNMRSAGVH